MGLILCDNKRILRPFSVDALGIHLYSLEELCYVIYENPILANEINNENLQHFLEDELGIHLHPMIEDRLLGILELSDYYSTNEINRYKAKRDELMKLSKHELLKAKGDFMFKSQRYARAIKYYNDAISEANYQKVPDKFYFDTWNNKGCAYANMFDYTSAFNAFKECLSYKKDIGIYKHIYHLSLSEPIIENRQIYLDYLGDNAGPGWDSEYEDILSASKASVAVEELQAELDTDSIKKHRLMGQKINSWKQKYRNFI